MNSSSTTLDITSLPWIFDPFVILLNVTNNLCSIWQSDNFANGEYDGILGQLVEMLNQLVALLFNLLLILIPSVSVLSFCLVPLVLPLIFFLKNRKIKKGLVLEIDLQQHFQVKDGLSDDPIKRKMAGTSAMSLVELIQVLEQAKNDDRVAGIVCYLGTGMFVNTFGVAVIQEFREALINFSKGNEKFTYCYANSFGEGANGTFAYYFATAFDKIYLQPSGEVGFAGLMIEQPFLKRTLEKLGLKPLLESRKKYKNMKNLFTETSFTEEHREATEALMNNIMEEVTNEIENRRAILKEDLTTLINESPVGASLALEKKLIDETMYVHKFHKMVDGLESVEKGNFLYLENYASKTQEMMPNLPKSFYRAVEKMPTLIQNQISLPKNIAIIYICGNIFTGKGVSGENSGSDSIVKAIELACEDDRISAILLRVDSGGGSYVASDAICDMVELAKTEYNKPVIVSMGNVAASGGYFVSCKASSIICNSLTFTGSIGVVFGKFQTTEFWNKLGIDWDDMNSHDNASLFTGRYDYSESQKIKLDKHLDEIYEDFKNQVAKGRNFEADHIEKVAQGRVWTGKDAHNVGLTDKIGGLTTALEVTHELLGLEPSIKLKLMIYPEWSIQSFLGGSKHTRDEVSTLSLSSSWTLRNIIIMLKNSIFGIVQSQQGILTQSESPIFS